MNPLAIIGVATSALEIAKSLAALGKDVWPIIQKVTALLTKGESATQADVDELRALNDQWNAEIQQSLPPEED